jgi:hypothetical protein
MLVNALDALSVYLPYANNLPAALATLDSSVRKHSVLQQYVLDAARSPRVR